MLSFNYTRQAVDDTDDDDRREAKAHASDPKLLRALHKASLFFCFLGAMGSSFLFILAGRQTPRVLFGPLVLWLILPFVVLLVAHRSTSDLSTKARFILYGVTLIVSVTSLAIYTYQVNWPRQSTPAFYWVLVPPASGLFMMITLVVSAIVLHWKAK